MVNTWLYKLCLVLGLMSTAEVDRYYFVYIYSFKKLLAKNSDEFLALILIDSIITLSKLAVARETSLQSVFLEFSYQDTCDLYS